MNFKSKNEIFVVPQVTLREVVGEFNSSLANFEPSIKRRILERVSHFSSLEKDSFKKGMRELKELNIIENPDVLDNLVDFWKYKNYKEKTKLSNEDKTLMYETLNLRSKNVGVSKPVMIKTPAGENPVFGHKLSRVSIGSGEDLIDLCIKYGFHDFFDPELGYDNKSFINFMDINFFKKDKDQSFRVKVADILSLNQYNSFLPSFAWRASLNYQSILNNSYAGLLGAVGISHRESSQQVFSLIGFRFRRYEELSLARPVVNLGYKYLFSTKFKFAFDSFLERREDENIMTGEAKFLYQNNGYSFGPVYRYSEETEYLLQLNYFF